VHLPRAVDVAVRRAVELGRVGFERMRAELLDIYGDRRGQALRARSTSNRAGEPSGLVKGGSRCFALALLEVTRGGVF
jgi:hypothetical protein